MNARDINTTHPAEMVFWVMSYVFSIPHVQHMLRFGNSEGKGRNKKGEKNYWFPSHLGTDHTTNFIYKRQQ